MPDPNRKPKYDAIFQLEIGESCVVPREPADTNQRLRSRVMSATARGRNVGRSFTTMREDEGLRVWRVT